MQNKINLISYKKTGNYKLAVFTFLGVGLILAAVQHKSGSPLLLTERLLPGAGWLQVLFGSLYAGFLSLMMSDIRKASKWRIRSWTIFSLIFFLQLAIGITLDERFLMTGKLHLPVPAMIISGPVYRGELTFMLILFMSTILLSGPAWCSHLCYFGALDGLASNQKSPSGNISNKWRIKYLILGGIILITLLFRMFQLMPSVALIAGLLFGLFGIFIIIRFSTRRGTMLHCTVYCPVGTVVNYAKYLNPIRFRIRNFCSSCGACSVKCRYDALSLKDIARKRPGTTCTYCGDCLQSCNLGALQYSFPGLSAMQARSVYLFLTITLHVVFLNLARI